MSKKLLAIVLMVMMLMSLMVTAIAEEPVEIRIMTGESGDNLACMLCEWLDWFRANRTGAEGWYHCNNSWESGQDGLARFTAGMTKENGPVEAANAEFVRTADLEAAMAYPEYTMSEFAGILGMAEDAERWRALAETGKAHVQSMFVDGWFRDFDQRTGKPFLNLGYYDPMLSMPFAMGFGTERQKEEADEIFKYFRETMLNPTVRYGYSLVWPPLLMTYTEACMGTGRQLQGAEAVAIFADSAYNRNDARQAPRMKRAMAGVPEKWNVILPGIAMETLSCDPEKAGCENYGWGALLPALILRIIFGISVALDGTIRICPALPANLKGERFSVRNLRLRGTELSVALEREADGNTRVTVAFSDGRTLAQSLRPGDSMTLQSAPTP